MQHEAIAATLISITSPIATSAFRRVRRLPRCDRRANRGERRGTVAIRRLRSVDGMRSVRFRSSRRSRCSGAPVRASASRASATDSGAVADSIDASGGIVDTGIDQRAQVERRRHQQSRRGTSSMAATMSAGYSGRAAENAAPLCQRDEHRRFESVHVLRGNGRDDRGRPRIARSDSPRIDASAVTLRTSGPHVFRCGCGVPVEPGREEPRNRALGGNRRDRTLRAGETGSVIAG